MNVKQKAVLLTLTIGIIITASIFYTHQLVGVGIIKALSLEVYGNPELTEEATKIDWGIIGAGETKDSYLWLKNTGNIAGILILETENWIPSSASKYIFLTWDYAGEVLSPQNVMPVKLSLKIAQNITGINIFSMNILITIYGN